MAYALLAGFFWGLGTQLYLGIRLVMSPFYQRNKPNLLGTVYQHIYRFLFCRYGCFYMGIKKEYENIFAALKKQEWLKLNYFWQLYLAALLE